jgi:AcrR family transcriptional regulator
MPVTLVSGSDSGARPRRADAQRSIDAIVTAARALLGERPEASMEEIASAAGISRQTVYAHFPSRDALLVAVVHSVRDEGLAAIEAAGLDELPPVEAMRTFLTISWQLLERATVLLEPMLARVSKPKSGKSHRGIFLVIEQIVQRGQESGDFDRSLPIDWIVAAIHSLGHVAAEQLLSGRLTNAQAAALLEVSVLRLCGVECDSAADALGPNGQIRS